VGGGLESSVNILKGRGDEEVEYQISGQGLRETITGASNLTGRKGGSLGKKVRTKGNLSLRMKGGKRIHPRGGRGLEVGYMKGRYGIFTGLLGVFGEGGECVTAC